MVPIPSQCYSFVKPLEWKFEVFTEIAYWMRDLKFTVTGPRGNIKKEKKKHHYPKTYESDCIKLAEFWLP